MPDQFGHTGCGHHAAGRPREHGIDGPSARRLHAHASAIGSGYVKGATNPDTVEALHQALEIPVHGGVHIGVEGGYQRPLVFADFRPQLGGPSHQDAG